MIFTNEQFGLLKDECVNKKHTLFVCSFHVSYKFFNAQLQGGIFLSVTKLNRLNL